MIKMVKSVLCVMYHNKKKWTILPIFLHSLLFPTVSLLLSYVTLKSPDHPENELSGSAQLTVGAQWNV